MNKHCSLILLSLLAVAAPAAAVEPATSLPRKFAALGDIALFVAGDELSGRELWRSDGTAAGTYLLADVCPGECSGAPVSLLACAGGLCYFHATTSDDFLGYRQALWVTDGTASGTRELWGPLQGVSGAAWVPEQKVLYFAVSEDFSGDELGRSDGTQAGTYWVTEINPDRAGGPKEITALRGRVWFVANDGQRGPSLWVSDGTDLGTSLFFDPVPSSAAHGAPRYLRAVGKRLVFTAPDGKKSRLWASDGTAQGTKPLTPALKGPLIVSTSRVKGGRLYFIGYDGRRGHELWVTDGTPGGTQVLTAFVPKLAFASGDLPDAQLSGRLLFQVDDGSHGLELWSTDGTPRGTRLLRDLCPGACGGVGTVWGVHRGLLWFSGAADGRGEEVWVTDGVGMRRVIDLCPGDCSSDPVPLGPIGDRMLFAARDDERGYQIWSSDGTAAGTVRLSDFDPALVIWIPGDVAVLPERLLFSAVDAQHGEEPWTTDGTPEGTHMVLDIKP